MNFLFSILYAPLVFFSLQYFDIKTVSLVIMIISILWLIVLRNKKDFSLLFPLFYISIAVLSFFSETFLVLKLMPLLISAFFSIFLLSSYLQKRSLILYFAKQFSKIEISEQEQAYIHRSTKFWFAISLINFTIHLNVFLDTNLNFWLYYSSIGWYFLFIFAGILQFFHRKYIFLRRGND